MQLSSPRAQRLAVAFLVAVLVATVALLFVNAHRVAHAEAVSAPAAVPQRPPRSGTGTGGQNPSPQPRATEERISRYPVPTPDPACHGRGTYSAQCPAGREMRTNGGSYGR